MSPKTRDKLVQEFVDRVVKDNEELKELLKQVLLDMSEEDLNIILKKLVRVEFAEDVSLEKEGYQAYVKPHQRFKGKWVMKINPEWWMMSLNEEWKKELLQEHRKKLLHHELSEVLQYTRKRESIHMLGFCYGESEGEPFECSICHKLTKNFYCIYFEVEEVKANPYLIEFESICESAGLDFENLIVCEECFLKCCKECAYLEYCDEWCRLPDRWLSNLRRLLKLV